MFQGRRAQVGSELEVCKRPGHSITPRSGHVRRDLLSRIVRAATRCNCCPPPWARLCSPNACMYVRMYQVYMYEQKNSSRLESVHKSQKVFAKGDVTKVFLVRKTIGMFYHTWYQLTALKAQGSQIKGGRHDKKKRAVITDDKCWQLFQCKIDTTAAAALVNSALKVEHVQIRARKTITWQKKRACVVSFASDIKPLFLLITQDIVILYLVSAIKGEKLFYDTTPIFLFDLICIWWVESASPSRRFNVRFE